MVQRYDQISFPFNKAAPLRALAEDAMERDHKLYTVCERSAADLQSGSVVLLENTVTKPEDGAARLSAASDLGVCSETENTSRNLFIVCDPTEVYGVQREFWQESSVIRLPHVNPFVVRHPSGHICINHKRKCASGYR